MVYRHLSGFFYGVKREVDCLKKILLVSSSKSFLERNKTLLTREDFLLMTAYCGVEALQLHQEYHFDLIVADLHLHDMGGDDLCTRLRITIVSTAVAIILICYDKAEEHARIARSGADAKIIRPVQPEQIIDTVGGLLNVSIGRTKRAIFKVNVLSRKGEVKFSCMSLDISITGILIETSYNLDIGDRIICQFTLPGGSKIESEGDVVRCVKTHSSLDRYGIQFIALPLGYRREIERYIAADVAMRG
jgi:CheY-like chemotaxis protein